MNENGILAAIFLALGITVPAPAVAGGMLFALGCAYAVRAFRAEGKRGLVLTLFVGGFMSLIAAAAHTHTAGVWIWGDLPVQLQMAASGALSQTFFEVVSARAGGFFHGLADKFPGGTSGDRK